MFARAFVINLSFKLDRLGKFQASLPQCLGDVTVWPAVHGDTVRHPDWWTAGAGAWGCYRSHLAILEHCYNAEIESYVVFEDDAIFRPEFEQDLQAFLAALPGDWEQIYLGGQLLHEVAHPPRRENGGCYVPYNVNRTHCFAVHRRGYEKLYRHLNAVPFRDAEHIDHHLGRLHESGQLKLYCPPRWLVGQDGGPSNISGNMNGSAFWVDPEKISRNDWIDRPLPVVFLEGPIEVAVELERRGWHRGHWQNDERLDRGVCKAIASIDCRAGLHQWFKAVQPEGVREGSRCVCLYHSTLTWACVSSLEFAEFVHIRAATIDEAEAALAIHLEGATDPPVVLQPVRHLIYHIWPKKGPGIWQWNIAQLLKRMELFDGTRSIGVVTDDESNTLADVQAAFDGYHIDRWIHLPNDRERGESVTFPQLLETIPRDPGHVTFYGHAKGVRHDGDHNTQRWAGVQYEVCLDDWPHVRTSLENYPITGAFQRSGHLTQPGHHGWHYSGTFFWFRNADVFSHPEWENVPQNYFGSELWPGTLFRADEAGSLFGHDCGDLYDDAAWSEIQPWLNEWRSAKEVRRPLRHKAESALTVPIYINARNLLTPLRKLVEYLADVPGALPIIVDNDSTWQPLLDYYERECPVRVIRTGINGGHLGWAAPGIMLDHQSLGMSRYVVTDSDLDLTGIPLDLLDVLNEGLDRYPDRSKCGLSLDIDHIPDDCPLAQEVREWEAPFWREPMGKYFAADIDTTFAMRKADERPVTTTGNGLRVNRPYTAVHIPWLWHPPQITDEISHYLATASASSTMWAARLQQMLIFSS